MTGKPARHRWAEKRVYPHKSERDCLKGCGTTMVRHHQADGPKDLHWTEFYRNGEPIVCEGTPPCVPDMRNPAGGPPDHMESLTHE